MNYLITADKQFCRCMFIILATFACMALERPVYSLEVSPQKGYVNDLAGLLPHDYVVDLDARLKLFEQQVDHKIMILTITRLESGNIEKFNRPLFPDLQLELSAKSVLLVIIKNERKVLIESSPALAHLLNNQTAMQDVENAVVLYLDGYKPEVGVEYGLELLVKQLNIGRSLGSPAKGTAFWNGGEQGFAIVLWCFLRFLPSRSACFSERHP